MTPGEKRFWLYFSWAMGILFVVGTFVPEKPGTFEAGLAGWLVWFSRQVVGRADSNHKLPGMSLLWFLVLGSMLAEPYLFPDSPRQPISNWLIRIASLVTLLYIVIKDSRATRKNHSKTRNPDRAEQDVAANP